MFSDVYGALGKLPKGPGPSRSREAPSTWSYAMRWSKPAASAVRAKRRMASGSVPLSACENTTPIFTGSPGSLASRDLAEERRGRELHLSPEPSALLIADQRLDLLGVPSRQLRPILVRPAQDFAEVLVETIAHRLDLGRGQPGR